MPFQRYKNFIQCHKMGIECRSTDSCYMAKFLDGQSILFCLSLISPGSTMSMSARIFSLISSSLLFKGRDADFFLIAFMILMFVSLLVHLFCFGKRIYFYFKKQSYLGFPNLHIV